MRYIRQIETLLLVSEMLATNSGQKEILTEILNLLEKHLSYLRGTILLLSKDGSVLTIEAVNATSTDMVIGVGPRLTAVISED